MQRLVSPSPLAPSLPPPSLSLPPFLSSLSPPPLAEPQEKKNVGFDCHLLGIWKNDSVGNGGRRRHGGWGGKPPYYPVSELAPLI